MVTARDIEPESSSLGNVNINKCTAASSGTFTIDSGSLPNSNVHNVSSDANAAAALSVNSDHELKSPSPKILPEKQPCQFRQVLLGTQFDDDLSSSSLKDLIERHFSVAVTAVEILENSDNVSELSAKLDTLSLSPERAPNSNTRCSSGTRRALIVFPSPALARHCFAVAKSFKGTRFIDLVARLDSVSELELAKVESHCTNSTPKYDCFMSVVFVRFAASLSLFV
jgi:hypothetical protein